MFVILLCFLWLLWYKIPNSKVSFTIKCDWRCIFRIRHVNVFKFLRSFACDKVKTFFVLNDNSLILCGAIRVILIAFVYRCSMCFKPRAGWIVIKLTFKTSCICMCITLVSLVGFVIYKCFEKTFSKFYHSGVCSTNVENLTVFIRFPNNCCFTGVIYGTVLLFNITLYAFLP